MSRINESTQAYRELRQLTTKPVETSKAITVVEKTFSNSSFLDQLQNPKKREAVFTVLDKIQSIYGEKASLAALAALKRHDLNAAVGG